MKEELEKIEKEFNVDIEKVNSLKEVEDIRVLYLGKSGKFSLLMPQLKNASAEEKPIIGSAINEIKQRISKEIDLKLAYFKNIEIDKKLKENKIDVTLPSTLNLGSEHPINVVIGKMVKILQEMGFSLFFDNEICESEYNFDKLNIPSDHPARDSQDTFYLDNEWLLRSHTTTFQNRVMKQFKPPIKMMTYGKVYRGDAPDATHMPIFHQLDIMMIDENLTLADLKSFLQNFVQRLFGEKIQVRIRPSFFPFTEPSIEADMTCVKCGGKGCSVCKKSGWIEILGGGMMNNKVLEMGGIDTNKYSGIAFGIGIERVVMMLTGVTDLRILYENDVRMLSQYK